METRTAKSDGNGDSGGVHVLLAGLGEGRTRSDRACLRQAGAGRFTVLRSGLDAARLLDAMEPDERPGLVFVDEELSDMAGQDLVRLLRLHPAFWDLPVLLASGHSTEEAVLDAVDAGCSGYLVRPYSVRALTDQAGRALRHPLPGKARILPSRDGFLAALEQHEQERRRAAAPPPPPEPDQLQQGSLLLAMRRWDKARESFAQVLEDAQRRPEACLGLARAWQGKGHPARQRKYMHLAALAYLRDGRADDAGLVLDALRREQPSENPFHGLAFSCIRQGDFATAAGAYTLDLDKGGDRGAVHTHAARACSFTHQPTRAARALSDELARDGRLGQAQDIYDRIMGPPAMERDLHARAPVGPRTRLSEILAIARYTLQAYRGGADSAGSAAAQDGAGKRLPIFQPA